MLFRSFVVTLASLGLMGLTACSGSSDSSSSGSDTISVSGSLSTGVSGSSVSSKLVSGVLGKVGALAASCADGNYYQVYCVTFSENPVGASGSVNCAGGSSGDFVVSGIPKGEPFGCFVRASVDGASYSTVGTIEIPAQGSIGDTDSIVADSDMGINISVAGDGSVESDVVTDGRKSKDSYTSLYTDASQVNGIYQLACTDSTGGGVYDPAACKCFLADDYTGTSYTNQEECMADNASEMSGAVSMFIDFNIYDATANADILEDGQVVVSGGDRIQGVTIWGAMDASTSGRSGGEGLADFGTAMGLTWTGAFAAPATAPISWSTSVDANNDSTPATAVGALPGNSATLATWQAWLKAILSGALSEGWTCDSGDGADAIADADDAFCLQELSFEVLENESLILPRLHVEPLCDGVSGCSRDIADSRIWIEGVEFDYPSSWDNTQDPTAISVTHNVPSPKMRFVFEQWNPFPDGGGGFKQRNGYRRYYTCGAVSSGAEVEHSSCTGSNDGLECFVDEELGIKFLPATTNDFKVVFEMRTNVQGGQFHLTGGSQVSSTATDVCRGKIQSESVFFATADKQ